MGSEHHSFECTLSRRDVLDLGVKLGLAGGAAAVLCGRLFESAAAQDSSSGAEFPPADLPLLEITIKADGSIEVTSEVTAGTVLVRATAEEGVPYVSTMLFAKPDGLTEAEIIEGLSSPEVPAWAHTLTMTGGLDFETEAMGPTQELVAELAPGSWYAATASETPGLAPFEVTGEPVIVEIDAAVSVVMDHHDFTLPAEVPAGDQVWRATNADGVLHHVVLVSTATLMSDEEVIEALMAFDEEEASPEAESAGPPPIFPVGGIGLLSQDQVVYQVVSLEPGFYAALCFISDPGMDVPHAFVGMIESFTAV